MALEFACFDVVLAFAALFGLAAFFTLRCRVHSALSPLVSLCSVSLVLAAAGVAGVLRPAVWAVSLLCFGRLRCGKSGRTGRPCAPPARCCSGR